MNTLVTVIVPVYNIEPEYLHRCINSILNQTYENFELILVDDGSTDGSCDIINCYEKKDDRVKAIHKSNGGSSSARNVAIDCAKGEYLSFVDSDDYVEPWFLERLMEPVNRAKEENACVPQIVQVGRDEIDAKGNRLPDICTPPENDIHISGRDFFKDLIMHIGDCSFCTKVTAKELFSDEKFPEGKLNEDFHLLIQMLQKTNGVESLPGYGYHVFYRENSNTRKTEKNAFSRVFQDNIENADLVEKLVAENMTDLSEVAKRFGLFQRMDYMLHIPIDYMNKDYPGYIENVRYIKKAWPGLLSNQYLTIKNKLYLSLFAIAPKAVRKVHARIKHL